MKEALNGNTFFNTIAMLRHELQSLLLIVEGDDDYFALKDHPSGDLYLLPGYGGRGNVLAAAELADQRDVRGIRFLVDSDYDSRVLPNLTYPTNVFVSENHDVFMDLLIVGNVTIERVISAHSRSAERRDGITVRADQVREDAVHLAARVAALRVVNDRMNLELRLRDFPIGVFSTTAPTAREIATLAIQRSTTKITPLDLELHIERELPQCLADGSSAVGDHDLFKAISRVLRDHGVRVSHETLATSFLAAVGCDQIMQTRWYRTIETWAKTHDRRGFACPHAA